MNVEVTEDTGGQSECWCCGRTVPDAEMLHLGLHPEVAVCLNCARWLRRRAAERRDTLRASLAGNLRGVLRRARDVVIRRGWHRRPVIGAFLRRLDRWLP